MAEVFSKAPDNLPTIFVEGVTPFIAIILSVVIPILIIKGTTPKRLLLTILPDTLFLSAAVAAASYIMMTHPVKDLYYYTAALAVFAGILVGYLAIFHRFNLSCTRPIPNYHERGTDDEKEQSCRRLYFGCLNIDHAALRCTCRFRCLSKY